MLLIIIIALVCVGFSIYTLFNTSRHYIVAVLGFIGSAAPMMCLWAILGDYMSDKVSDILFGTLSVVSIIAYAFLLDYTKEIRDEKDYNRIAKAMGSDAKYNRNDTRK